MDKQSQIDQEVLQTIKQTVDPRQFLRPAKKGTFVCEWCGSGTGTNGTGMRYNKRNNKVHCFNPACGKDYDVVDVYQKVNGVDFITAVAELSHGECFQQRQDNCVLPARDEKKPAKDYTPYYEKCRPRLTDDRAVEYLRSRRITVDTVKAYSSWCGFDPAADTAETGKYFCPRLIIPSGKGHYVAKRTDGGEDCKTLNPKDATPEIANLQSMDAEGTCFVVEGAFDAMSIYEAAGGGNMPVTLNSTSNIPELLAYVKEHRPKALLLLALDDDKAGHIGTKQLSDGLAEMKIPYRVTHGLADGKKDSNDLWVENPEQFKKQVQMAMDPETRPQENPFDGFLQRITDGRHKAIKTGKKELDELMGGGFVPGKLTLIGAAPGKAKTAICQWIAETMAEHNKDLTALFLSLEMDKDELLARSLSRMMCEHGIADLSTFEILQGKNTAAIQQGIDKYLSLIGNRVQYNPGVGAEMSHSRSLQDILNTVNKAGRVDLLVVDYIQLVKSGGQSEMENIGNAMEALLELAKTKNCIVIAVMANNRESNKSGSDSLFTGRGSSDLEYSANYVLNITDEEMGDVPTGKRLLTLAKGRLAEVGRKLMFQFDGRHMRPHDLDLSLGREATKKEAKVYDDVSGLKVDRRAIKKK